MSNYASATCERSFSAVKTLNNLNIFSDKNENILLKQNNNLN